MSPKPHDRPAQRPRRGSRADHPVLIWLVTIALFSPFTLAVFLGPLKFTPGKLAVTLLVVPAMVQLLAGTVAGCRRLIMADLMAVAIAALMVISPLSVAVNDVSVGAASQALEFFGSYMIGRTYFFGGGALTVFAHALAAVLVVVTGLGLLDVMTGHFVVAEGLTTIQHPQGGELIGADPHFHRIVFGRDLLRATSTFDHPILYGTFCAISAALLAFAPLRPTLRLASLALCVLGALLALSSAPMLALMIAGSVWCYDAILRRVAWRWRALLVVAVGAIGVLCGTSNSPSTWLIRHLTLDPSTGYFRLLVWDAAFDFIGSHAWLGSGFQLTGNAFVDGSIDSLWLAKALNYGLPTVGLMFLLGISVIVPAGGQRAVRRRDAVIDRFSTAFSLAIVLFDVIGLTVYYWNGIWLFYALCLGIRAALKDYCLVEAKRRVVPARSQAMAPGRARHGAAPAFRRAPA